MWTQGFRGVISQTLDMMPVDEVAKRKRVSFDPYADGAGDMPMPASTPEVEVVSSGDDDDEYIPPSLFFASARA